MEMRKLWLFIGISFVAGFIWGGVMKDILPHRYSNPETPIGKYDQIVSVDLIRNGDDIWIVEHKKGDLIFEYNRFKEADKEAFKEFDDVLIETTMKQ